MFDFSKIETVNIGAAIAFATAQFKISAVPIAAELHAKQSLFAVDQHAFFRLLHHIIHPLAAFFFFFCFAGCFTFTGTVLRYQ